MRLYSRNSDAGRTSHGTFSWASPLATSAARASCGSASQPARSDAVGKGWNRARGANAVATFSVDQAEVSRLRLREDCAAAGNGAAATAVPASKVRRVNRDI